MLQSEQIIRNFNLYLLSDIELEEPYDFIFKSLKNKFKDLNMYDNGLPISDDGVVLYGKSKDMYILLYRKQTKQLWLDSNITLSVFDNTTTSFDMSLLCLKDIVEYMICYLYNIENVEHIYYEDFNKSKIDKI